MKLSKVQDNIMILVALQQAIQKYTSELVKIQDSKEKVTKSAYSSMILIMVNSYLAEWDLLEINLKNDKGMLKVRKCTTPALKEIRKWKGLQYYRNCYLAHSPRNKAKSNVLLEDTTSLNIPQSIPDMALLAGLLYCSNKILITQFSEDFDITIKAIKSHRIPTNKNGIKTLKEADEKLSVISKQITELIKTYNV